MSVFFLVGLGALVVTFLMFLKTLAGFKNDPKGTASAALKTLMTWAAGVGAVIVAAHTQVGGNIKIADIPLATTDWPTQLFLGVVLGSLLCSLNEIKKALGFPQNADSQSSSASSPVPSQRQPSGVP
jgi:hypothetical protein